VEPGAGQHVLEIDPLPLVDPLNDARAQGTAAGRLDEGAIEVANVSRVSTTQQRLNLRWLPQGQGSFRPTDPYDMGRFGVQPTFGRGNG
jgi:hypothetical protein